MENCLSSEEVKLENSEGEKNESQNRKDLTSSLSLTLTSNNNNNNNQPQNGCHSLNLLSPQSSTSSISDPVHDLPLSLLQQGWRKFWSKREQRPYFFNKITNESLWEMPPIPLDGTEITHYDPITDPLGIQSGDNQSNHFNRVCAPLRIGEKRPFLDDPYNGSCKKFILR